MARVVRFHAPGDAGVLRIEQVDVADPGPGLVRIRVEAIGLNRSDILYRNGVHPVRCPFPSLIGSEAAGRIDAIGPDVDGFAIGDTVSVIPRMAPLYGTCGELILVPAAYVVRHPASLSMQEAAALWSSYLTAYGALTLTGGLEGGQTVVLTAASSSVGLAAIQVARMLGAVPIATTRTRDKAAALIDAGAEHVIVTDEEDVAARLAEVTAGRGVELVFDAIGGPGVEPLAGAIAQGGRYLIYGVLSTDPTPFPVATAFANGMTMTTFALDLAGDPPTLAIVRKGVEAGIAGGWIKPKIARTFPIEQIADAHRYMESNQQFGKILLTID